MRATNQEEGKHIEFRGAVDEHFVNLNSIAERFTRSL